MLPQPIIEIVTGALPPCAGAAGAAVAPPAAGAAGLPPHAASRLRPAAPRPSWPARRRNPRRDRRCRVGIGELSSLDICVLSFEVGRSENGGTAGRHGRLVIWRTTSYARGRGSPPFDSNGSTIHLID